MSTDRSRRRTAVAATRAGAWGLVVLLALIVVTLSLQPGTEELGRRRFRFDASSAGHAMYFAFLGFLLANAIVRQGVRRPVWWSIVVAALFGIATELAQASVPMRTPSMADLVADLVGSAAPAAAFVVVRARHEGERGRHAVAASVPPDRPQQDAPHDAVLVGRRDP
jgi:VanZ family protein